MTRGTRLELTWVGKHDQPRLEPRILLDDETKSYCAKERVTEKDRFDNLLIKGDNLLALKALEHQYAGKVKCIYIDPPYNTGSAFTHYDDGMEHSLWLTMMRDRLVVLRRLLSEDGSIWVHCDDHEQAYLKVMMDEVFGRTSFVTTVVWQKVDSPNDNKVPLTPDHEYVLVYLKGQDWSHFKPMHDPSLLDAYRRDADGTLYRDRLLKKNGKNSLREDRPTMHFAVRGPDGKDVFPIHDDGREACWSLGKTTVTKMNESGELIWKRRELNGEQVWVPYTRERPPVEPQRPHPTMWLDVQTSRQAKAHQKELLPSTSVFSTPKPEPLIHRILHIATNPGDLVLDSFAGSGTTGAVAHKMGRRWIMVELGEHCDTHIVPRLHKVIDGADPGGVTEATGWKGGGGFRYCTLAPSLLAQDDRGNWVISKQYNAAMLAQAVCVHEGFVYAPSRELYWLHGEHRDSPNTFLWVTTQTLTRERLERLSTEVGEGRHLMVCCLAFKGDPTGFPNLVVKKLPSAILDRCEWGKDDYSLRIAALGALPAPEPDAGTDDAAPAEAAPAAAKKKGKKPKEPPPAGQGSLFGGDEKKGG